MIWIIASIAVMMLADWFIVMGWNPKEWKGGEKK